MIINRVWSMPNKNTFEIKPINKLIRKYINSELWIDPFSRNNCLKKDYNIITNDMNKNIEADYNLESLEFLKLYKDRSIDGVLFDPPYSPRQISESYGNIGIKCSQKDTQSSFYSLRKDEISRVLKINGICISFGWNSQGIGKNRGFEIIEILLVSHGGAHNDTICVVDRKIK